MQPPHPAAGRLHLDALWWTAGAETSEREIYRRAGSGALVSSAKPTTGIQVVRPAAPTASTRSLLMPTEQGLSTPGQHDALLANASEARARVR
jgi:hypothetical protein